MVGPVTYPILPPNIETTKELPILTYGIEVWSVTDREALEQWMATIREEGWSPVGEPHIAEAQRCAVWRIDLNREPHLRLRWVNRVALVSGRLVRHPGLTIPWRRNMEFIVVRAA
jgi:hypothetical protein